MENERLRSSTSDEGLEQLSSYREFLEDDDVKEVIEEAKSEDYPSQKYYSGILASIIAEGGAVTYEDVADRLGVSRTNEVSSAATTLESYKIVEKENRTDGMHVDLNVDGLTEIREAARRRRETADLMEGI